MCNYAYELVASRRDDELAIYLLPGFNEDYNLVFTPVIARVDPIKLAYLYA
jgi:hypothetical protein